MFKCIEPLEPSYNLNVTSNYVYFLYTGSIYIILLNLVLTVNRDMTRVDW